MNNPSDNAPDMQNDLREEPDTEGTEEPQEPQVNFYSCIKCGYGGLKLLNVIPSKKQIKLNLVCGNCFCSHELVFPINDKQQEPKLKESVSYIG